MFLRRPREEKGVSRASLAVIPSVNDCPVRVKTSGCRDGTNTPRNDPIRTPVGSLSPTSVTEEVQKCK